MNNRLTRFKTRERANEGTRLPLIDPVTGEDSGEWIHILGIDSDKCRAMKTEGSRALLRAGNSDMTDEDVAALVEDWKMKQLAVLVVDWSFAEGEDPWPCTTENVVELLTEAPHIADAIDRAAAKRALFYKDPSKTDSTTLPGSNSNSTDAQKAQKQPTASTTSKSPAKLDGSSETS